jgi:hypothetical protein
VIIKSVKRSFLALQKLLAKTGFTIIKVRGRYMQDGLFTVHCDQFRKNAAFRAAYNRGVRASQGVDPEFEWRVHTALWAAVTCLKAPGDFVECGVNAGFISSAIMQYLDWNETGRDFYLIDTFSGPVLTQYSATEAAAGRVGLARETLAAGGYVTDLERVRANFAEWKRARVVQGAVPEILERIDFQTVAFVHLDMNCAWPEQRALDLFYGRLARGGMILFDDYTYWGHDAQRVVIEETASRLGVQVLALPTGQGLLVK